jgi:hypothetical protein
MSAAAPSKDTKSNDPAVLVPPEEQFWKHYSPHGEAPLSAAGSVTLHALAVGIFLLFSIFLASLFIESTRPLPVEPVRLVGGGGGKRTGQGDAKGVGTGAAEDADPTGKEEKLPGQEEDVPPRPALTPVEKAKVREEYNPADYHYIENTEQGKALARVEKGIARKLRDGINPGKGRGGPGSGGGKDGGRGTGEGTGVGPGKNTASLSQREKRMLRWHMRFTANTGQEYLKQLRGLGAILAIPVREGEEPQYKVIRDLRSGAPLLDEDLSKIQRIYWIDDKPSSVRDIMMALGHPELRPNRFVAFMPEKLEAELFRMEKNYVENVLGIKPFNEANEDKVGETNFRVVPTARGYRPELINVTLAR